MWQLWLVNPHGLVVPNDHPALWCQSNVSRSLQRATAFDGSHPTQKLPEASVGVQALASNNLEKVASTMEQFERQFENLDVQSQFVESAMNNQASLSTPEEDVNLLMQQVCPWILPCPTHCRHFNQMIGASLCPTGRTSTHS